ncbi:MAG: hypothetical protein LKI23_05500 [Bifidobacterium crudilactis]|jgi:hypothetical protein|nr:hypothetical protein [Bifidobacterium crudilactis]
MVITLYSQSSVAKDVANQEKFIHAHQMAKNTIAYIIRLLPIWPVDSRL